MLFKNLKKEHIKRKEHKEKEKEKEKNRWARRWDRTSRSTLSSKKKLK